MILDLKSNVFVVIKNSRAEKNEIAQTEISFELTKWNSIPVPEIANHNYQCNLLFYTTISDASLTIKACKELPSADSTKEVLVETWTENSTTTFGKETRYRSGRFF